MKDSTSIRVRPTTPFAWFLAGVTVFAASALAYRQVYVSHPFLWQHTDEWVYRAAGSEVRRHPADLYRIRMAEPGFFPLSFTYPPFAALIFAVFSPLGFGAWQIGLVVLDLILLPVIIYASLRISGHHGFSAGGLAFGLAAVALWLEPVYMTMFFGQINLILLALIVVDLSLPDSCRWKGIGIGIAAGAKLTPLIFIPYLLASRRVRAAVVGTLSFAATAVIGFVALPAASRQYWGGKSAAEGGLQRLLNQSVNGVVQRLLPGDPAANKLWAVLAIVVAAAGLTTAAVASRRSLELLGIVLCGVTGLLVSPLSWSHHWVWVVPGLALMADGASRGGTRADGSPGVRPRDWIARAAGGAAIIALFGMWPTADRIGHAAVWLPHGLLRFAPHGSDLEYTWHGAMLLLGNSYVIAGAAAITGAAVYLRVTRDRARRVPAPSGIDDQVTSARMAVLDPRPTRAGDD